jgi:hypothetical protein
MKLYLGTRVNIRGEVFGPIAETTDGVKPGSYLLDDIGASWPFDLSMMTVLEVESKFRNCTRCEALRFES